MSDLTGVGGVAGLGVVATVASSGAIAATGSTLPLTPLVFGISCLLIDLVRAFIGSQPR